MGFGGSLFGFVKERRSSILVVLIALLPECVGELDNTPSVIAHGLDVVKLR